ncbi:MAG: DUF362 domain-containing protein [Desulfovibrionaceae bacterium]|nr:DUF362 domain-containing protein [Desulfovibrionaceae bacterium]MBF0515227.1 DUF362 domain-containing protein [Desulfovibrionaceae bacterium]
MHKVMIHSADYQSCKAAVERAFELFALPVRGKKVLLKPNVLRAATPEEAVTTHPAVLTAVIQRLEELGAGEIVVGDNPGVMGYGANEACFEKSGLLAAAGKYYRNIGLEASEVPFNPAYQATLSVSKAVLDADLFISLPKFKTHGLTVITGAIKNSYGILPGAQKALLHRLAGDPARFQDVVVDVFRLRPPDLIIVDAVLGMQGNGPASTELRWIGKLLAADNAVAMDAVICRMMGLDPALLPSMRKAVGLGLGDFAEETIECAGELTPIADFKLPPLSGEGLSRLRSIQELLETRAAMRPAADPARCTACGACIAQCPVQALAFQDNLPVVDASKCIACFCCQEMCPEKAIALK